MGLPDATIFPVRSRLSGRVASEERGDRVFHIIRDRDPRDDPGPHFERWGGDQIVSKGHRLQIIMEVRSPAAMDGIASCPYSGSALSPVACAAQVGTSRISEEDIGPATKALSAPGELTAQRSQGRKIRPIRHRDQQVGVLWIRLARCQGTDEGDSGHSWELAGEAYESHRFCQEPGTERARCGRSS